MNLNRCRKTIDKIDKKLVELFEKRMRSITNVAEFKKRHSLDILQSDREIKLLKKIDNLTCLEYKDYTRVLFTTIINISKSFQSKYILENFDPLKIIEEEFNNSQTVAYFGEKGSYCYDCANLCFSTAKMISCESFEDVFKKVNSNQIDLGILPIDNSNVGTINQVYDLLLKYNTYIIGEKKLKISHCLAGKSNLKITEIQRVYSHPQALNQCQGFLNDNNLVGQQCSSTAKSARFVSEQNNNFAAICSESTANYYNLKIIKKKISKNDENYTRFIIISNRFINNTKNDVISIAFTIEHKTGSLYETLIKFNLYNKNIIKIQSLPIGNANFDVRFYLDFIGNIKEEKTLNLLKELKNDLKDYKFLGCYINHTETL